MNNSSSIDLPIEARSIFRILAIKKIVERPEFVAKLGEQFDDLPRMEDIPWDKIGSTLNRVWDRVVKSTQTDGFKHAFGNHLEKIDGRIKVVED